MNSDFFNEKFQKKIWGYPSNYPYDKNKCFTSFEEFFENCENKKLVKTYSGRRIFKNIALKVDSYDELKINISINKNLPNNTIYDGYETSIGLYIPNGFVSNYSYNKNEDLPFYKKQLIFNSILLDKAKKLNISINKKFDGGNNNYLIFSPICTKLNNPIENDSYDIFNADPVFGWNAIDFKIINDYTIILYVTALPSRENINFNNLVCDVSFSLPIVKDLKIKTNI